MKGCSARPGGTDLLTFGRMLPPIFGISLKMLYLYLIIAFENSPKCFFI